MSVADNSVIRAAAHFTGLNVSDVVNVFHFVMDSVGDVSEAHVLDDLLALVQALMANVEGHYSTDLALDALEAWVWNSALSRWDKIGEIDGTWTGTQGSVAELPAQNAPQVNADTVDSHAHGRKYLPPMLETATDSGLITTTVQALMADYLADLVATYIGTYAEWAPGVWSVASAAFKLFSGTGKALRAMGTQRRRKLNVGS
jgi:hypothetical protein